MINVKKVGNQYQVMLPEPAGFCSKIPSPRDILKGGASRQDEDSSLQIIHTPEEVFLNGQANRIVVWNGKQDNSGEQLLICSDRSRSTTGQKEAVLSIMPLPGEPIEIRRVSDNFNALQTKLEITLYGDKQEFSNEHPEWNGRITSYCVQSFETDNLEDFLFQAENMVSSLYGNSAQLQWQPTQLSAIQLLLDFHYKWFALDVSLLRDWVTFTEPIAYQTKSDSVCVPLLEGRIGGANSKSVTSVIVITPNKVMLNEKEGLSNKDVVFLSDQPVELSVEELQGLSPESAAFCKKHKIEKVFVQQLYIRNYITKYPGDLIMINAPEEKAPEQNAQAPAEPSDNDKPVVDSKSNPQNKPYRGRRNNHKDSDKDANLEEFAPAP